MVGVKKVVVAGIKVRFWGYNLRDLGLTYVDGEMEKGVQTWGWKEIKGSGLNINVLTSQSRGFLSL
jgi:hypothetical protein